MLRDIPEALNRIHTPDRVCVYWGHYALRGPGGDAPWLNMVLEHFHKVKISLPKNPIK